MQMATSVLEEMVKALEYADDSDGDFGSCIESAMEVLFNIADKQLDEEVRKELFDYCTTAYDNRIFEGWDWHFNLQEIASKLVMSKEEAAIVHAKLDKIKPNGSDWDWNLRQAQLIRLKLITRTEGQEKAELFMEENISNSDIRKMVIESAITRKDYEKAISLCEKGIVMDEETFPGLANDWRNYLLKIYLKQNNVPYIIDTARNLFIESNQPLEPLFETLKKYVHSTDWSNFLETMIQDLTIKNYWSNNPRISQIYIWEQRWLDLLDIVKKKPTLSNLESYEKYLAKDFPDEISDLYKTAIHEYMRINMGRNHYKEACRYLRRMKKMGAKAKASATIDELKNLYPQRRALLEELAKV